MGPAQPFWLGAPLIALGAASAVIGALRANLEDDTKTLLACSTIENVGLIAIGFGLALAFRGADLPALAALAAGAALLHALNHAVFKTLLFLAAGEVLHGAASRRDGPAGRADPSHAGHGLGGAGRRGGGGRAAAAVGLRLGMAAAAGAAGGLAGGRPGLPDGGRGGHRADGAGGGAGGGGDGALLGAGLPRPAAHAARGGGGREPAARRASRCWCRPG